VEMRERALLSAWREKLLIVCEMSCEGGDVSCSFGGGGIRQYTAAGSSSRSIFDGLMKL
jgi:hypothetical protein